MRYKELKNNIIGIYKINFPNNKVYIGLSKDVKRRVREHFWGTKKTLCDIALKKYFNDINDFEIELLEIFKNIDYKKLSERESYYIAKYKSNNKEFGYNLTEGGLPSETVKGLPWKKLNIIQIKEIHTKLLNNCSNIELSKEYGVVPDIIGKINQGKYLKLEGYTYPLRDNHTRKSTTGLKNHNSPPLEKIEEIYNLLKTGKYTYNEIAKKVGMSYTHIANFNLGKLSYCNELSYSYPIQKKIKGRRIPLTKQEGLQIINLLKENKLTQKEIGILYECSYQSISRINNGNLFKQDNENYPIRKSYPKKSK